MKLEEELIRARASVSISDLVSYTTSQIQDLLEYSRDLNNQIRERQAELVDIDKYLLELKVKRQTAFAAFTELNEGVAALNQLCTRVKVILKHCKKRKREEDTTTTTPPPKRRPPPKE